MPWGFTGLNPSPPKISPSGYQMTAHLPNEKLIRSITSSFHYFIMVQWHNTGIFWKLVCNSHPPPRHHIHVWTFPYPLSITVLVTAQLIPVSLFVCCGLWDLKRFQYCSFGFDLHLSLGVRWTNPRLVFEIWGWIYCAADQFSDMAMVVLTTVIFGNIIWITSGIMFTYILVQAD